MSLAASLKFILNHPLNHDRKMSAMQRYIKWQLGSRLFSYPIIIPFANDSHLIAQTGMTAATGNFYCGLYEFEDMSFLLHFLRAEDLFCDIGANIGAYTILAAAAVGAKTLTIEPIPSTFKQMVDNVYLNHVVDRVKALNIGIGKEAGLLRFTSNLSTTNRVILDGEEKTDSLTVPISTLDEIITDRIPSLIKIDVEGFETPVIEGGRRVLTNPNLQAVIMESNGSGATFGFDEHAIYEQMLDYGFVTCSYEPIKRNLTQTQFRNTFGNTLYVRDFDYAASRVLEANPFTINGRSI